MLTKYKGSGLTWLKGLVSIKATLSLLSSVAQGRENMRRVSCIEIRMARDHLLITGKIYYI